MTKAMRSMSVAVQDVNESEEIRLKQNITKPTYLAERRCMYCNCLLGYKDGFPSPGLVTHGTGGCCKEFEIRWYRGEI